MVVFRLVFPLAAAATFPLAPPNLGWQTADWGPKTGKRQQHTPQVGANSKAILSVACCNEPLIGRNGGGDGAAIVLRPTPWFWRQHLNLQMQEQNTSAYWLSPNPRCRYAYVMTNLGTSSGNA